MDQVSSHQALQIALKTMKQRCQALQQRVSYLEEENYSLKVKLSRENKESNISTISEDHLKEQLCLLSKQKEQLSQHIQMVAKENQTLWGKLGQLDTANSNLGNYVSKIRDTLNKHDSASLEDEENLQKSLEEISLKLINGILMEKTELERQYKEMIDLQNGGIDVEDLRFSMPSDEDNLLNDMNNHYDKLKQFKNVLQTEQNNLKFILNNIQNLNSQDPKAVYNQSSTIELTEETENVESSNEKICPMCEVNFTGAMEAFADHVTAHFSEEDDLVGSNFEMYPP